MKKRSVEPPEPANRRAHPRSPVVVREARCIAGIDVFFGYATNLSRSGLFINSPRTRAPGEEFEIRFTLPKDDHAYTCRARVVWCRSYHHNSRLSPGFGLGFIDLPEDEGDRIEAWVLAHPARESEE